MKLASFALITSLFLILPTVSFGQQFDPSAFSFSGSATGVEDGMEKTRYIKKAVPGFKKRKPAQQSENATSDAGPEKKTNNESGGKQGSSASDNAKLEAEQNAARENKKASAGGTDERSVGTQARDLFLGGDIEELNRFRSTLEVDDIRRNIFELSIATSYMYNTSTSPYFYRNYYEVSPDAAVGVDIWLTPYMAIDGDYRISLLSALKDSPTTDIYTTTTNTWYGLGFKFRRFFGFTPTSSSLVFGLRYVDYALSVAPNSFTRLRQHTKGPELSLDISIPATRAYVWTLGLMVQPYLIHDESVLNGNDLRAGQSNQTVGMGARVGGEYHLSRATQIFFKLSTQIYKNQFSGSTLATDPISGSNPSNVNINNVFYFIDLGLRLGH
jgi:hypothetical protein